MLKRHWARTYTPRVRPFRKNFFFVFFAFFALNFLLCFNLVIFASKRNEGKFFSLQKKQNSIFFAFFRFPISFQVKKKTFLSIFSINFHFASIFSLNFRLFYLRFRFRFLVFRIEVNHVKSGFFSPSKRNKIFASTSNFASEARAHPIYAPFRLRIWKYLHLAVGGLYRILGSIRSMWGSGHSCRGSRWLMAVWRDGYPWH